MLPHYCVHYRTGSILSASEAYTYSTVGLMANQRVWRKAQFKAALELADKTQKQWAAEQGISDGHLRQVLAGIRESASLVEKVDEFIRKQLMRAA